MAVNAPATESGPESGAGSIELDAYILDVLMPDLVGHDRKPGAFLVYLLLECRCRESGAGKVEIPLREIAAGTGLSKRAVQDAVAHLIQRRLLSVTREGITSIAEFTPLRPWRGVAQELT